MKNPRERIISAILLLAILFIVYSIIISSASDLSVSAKAAALYEPSTDAFLFSKNADERLPMASTTKIMTALVAIENFPLEEKIEVSDSAIGIEGSSLYLKKGEILTMRELLVGLLLRSANDAAAAIAYAVCGGIDEFADLMNEKCQELGLKDTNFTNPHGLDNENHYTTAKELAIIASEALKNDFFKETVSKKSEKITNENGETRLISNHNKLLSLYEGAIGIKTGFTKKSGRCLVGACDRDGLTFVTVTINAPDDWNDHISMFNYGYSQLVCQRVARAGEYCYDISVIGGNSLTVSNEESFNVITKKGAPDAVAHVKLPRYTAAPIKKGDILGKIIFTIDNSYVGEINLIAQNDVNKTEKKKFFSFF